MRWTVSMENSMGDWPVRSYTFHVSRLDSKDVFARFENKGDPGGYVRGGAVSLPAEAARRLAYALLLAAAGDADISFSFDEAAE